jgi:hypothetical protein
MWIVAAALLTVTAGRGAWAVTIVEYPIPTRLGTPAGITAGGDGARLSAPHAIAETANQ